MGKTSKTTFQYRVTFLSQLLSVKRKAISFLLLCVIILLTSCVQDSFITITFDPQGGTSGYQSWVDGQLVPNTMIVAYGQPLESLYSVEKEGYFFDGWWTGEDGTGEEMYWGYVNKYKTDFTLYANWERLVTVTFDSHGGVNSPDPGDEKVFRKYYFLGEPPTRDGYAFSGWWTCPDGEGALVVDDSTINIREDHTLYAKWNPVNEVTFDPMGGSSLESLKKQVIYDNEYGPLPRVSKYGYKFNGWWTLPDSGGIEIFSNSSVNFEGNHGLYARWEPLIKVTFDAQGGIELQPKEKFVEQNSPYGELASVISWGYTFEYWSTEPDGNGIIVTPSSIVNIDSDHILYANWQSK